METETILKVPVRRTYGINAWRICMAASLFPFYAFIQMNFLNTLGVYLINDRIVNYNQLGILSASYIYTDALLLLPAGILLDRYATKSLLLWGALFCIIGGILFASFQQFSVLFISRLLAGMGHAFALLGCFRLVSHWFHAKQQGFVIGLIITIALLGGLVAQTPLILLIELIGWQKALWVNVTIGLLIIFIIWLNLPTDRINFTNKNVPNLWNNLKVASKNKQNWLCGLYTCLLGVPLMVLGALWGSTYLVSSKQLSVLEASCVSTSIFLGTIIGSPFVGWLSDRLDTRKLPMIVGAGLSILLMLVILFSSNFGIIEYIGLFFLLSICASTQVIGYPVVIESNSISNNSTAMGFVNVLIMSGIATLQIIFGSMWNISAFQSYAIYILLFALAISLVVALFIKEALS